MDLAANARSQWADFSVQSGKHGRRAGMTSGIRGQALEGATVPFTVMERNWREE